VGTHQTLITQTQASTLPISRTQAGRQPIHPDRYFVRPQNRDRVGRPAPGTGVWLRNDLLATPARLATGGRVEGHPPHDAQPFAQSQQNQLVSCRRRQFKCSRRFWGAQTGSNPADRGKNGSKHHVLTDANGIPLSIILTSANRHDVTQLLPLVDSVPPVSGKRGRPRQTPKSLWADKAYDSMAHRMALWYRGIKPMIPRRSRLNPKIMGRHRWVVERTISWLHQYRRLRVRYERRADMHEAFMILGCIHICYKCLKGSYC